MRSVTGPEFAQADHFRRDDLAVISPADPGHQINEHGREVQLDAELAGRVVPRERVVVVVEAVGERREKRKRMSRKTPGLYNARRALRSFSQERQWEAREGK